MCESLCVAALTVAFFSRNLYPECPALNELFFYFFFFWLLLFGPVVAMQTLLLALGIFN